MFILLAPGVILGCGGSPSTIDVRLPVDGGAMIRLPGNRGFFAIKTEGPSDAGGRKKKNQATTIVATFYQADGVTPMSPAPTDVVLKLGAEGSAMPVTLTADTKDLNRFTSSPGLYSQGLQGTVHLKISGEDVEESFSAL
jgi:hypothetical protein